jgi:hypothetical protein
MTFFAWVSSSPARILAWPANPAPQWERRVTVAESTPQQHVDETAAKIPKSGLQLPWPSSALDAVAGITPFRNNYTLG